ncbi:hypothetical protein [Roseimicrobium sp. ORNL1]|uniref:hypothetical protein n=1 Tax=Roseimicrobium sp. ORNL1 TaxID=2711231 RepID=UPI0013E113AF|nr:hypothetical protein [Roseimicrobium sp. ORNL1]QIF01790.1 hypothetical protein G5S37_09715 [Roseimicrobium sp. ORNL1]
MKRLDPILWLVLFFLLECLSRAAEPAKAQPEDVIGKIIAAGVQDVQALPNCRFVYTTEARLPPVLKMGDGISKRRIEFTKFNEKYCFREMDDHGELEESQSYDGSRYWRYKLSSNKIFVGADFSKVWKHFTIEFNSNPLFVTTRKYFEGNGDRFALPYLAMPQTWVDAVTPHVSARTEGEFRILTKSWNGFVYELEMFPGSFVPQYARILREGKLVGEWKVMKWYTLPDDGTGHSRKIPSVTIEGTRIWEKELYPGDQRITLHEDTFQLLKESPPSEYFTPPLSMAAGLWDADIGAEVR